MGRCELSSESPTEEGDPRLTDPWRRAWSTGSVREAEVKSCGAGAETSPRTEAGSPEHRRQSSPLGCWGGDAAGWAGSICLVAISPDSSVVTLGGGSERLLFYFFK